MACLFPWWQARKRGFTSLKEVPTWGSWIPPLFLNPIQPFCPSNHFIPTLLGEVHVSLALHHISINWLLLLFHTAENVIMLSKTKTKAYLSKINVVLPCIFKFCGASYNPTYSHSVLRSKWSISRSCRYIFFPHLAFKNDSYPTSTQIYVGPLC